MLCPPLLTNSLDDAFCDPAKRLFLRNAIVVPSARREANQHAGPFLTYFTLFSGYSLTRRTVQLVSQAR